VVSSNRQFELCNANNHVSWLSHHLRDALEAEYARDRDLEDRLVLLSDELSVPVDMSAVFFWSIAGGQLTARVVRVVRATIAHAALIIFPVSPPLQAEYKCQAP
jgi:hypothetical protein